MGRKMKRKEVKEKKGRGGKGLQTWESGISDLLPINMIVMLELEFNLASSNHPAKWLKVSLLIKGFK